MVVDADPRYPILFTGLVDHPIENVSISNVVVEYRGGLKMDDAVEQRQLNQTWAYTPYLELARDPDASLACKIPSSPGMKQCCRELVGMQP